MKYIKLFESKKSDSPYKAGDYVLFYDEDEFDINGKIKNGRIIDLFVRKGTLWYEIEMIEGDLIGYHTSVLYPDIRRLLTPDEIELIETKNDANKYNL